MSNDMVKEKSWKEFRESGLFWFVNSILHMFGWALVLDVTEDGEIDRVYPARVKFRGFDSKLNDKGYKMVTDYLDENIEELKKEVDEG